MWKCFWSFYLGSIAGKLWDAIQQNWRRKNLSACIWWTESSVWKRRTSSQVLLCCRQDRTLTVTYFVWQGKQLWIKLDLGICICNYGYFFSGCVFFFPLELGRGTPAPQKRKRTPRKYLSVSIWMRNPREWLITILGFLYYRVLKDVA